MTETCEDDEPHLIIHTETTLATTPDNAVTDTIHHALEGQALLPHTHLVDAGYLDAEMLVTSRSVYEVDMLGPVSLAGSWQAQAATGFDVTHFHIDWAAHRVSCPASRTSRWWMSSTDRHAKEAIRVKFAPADCQGCPLRLNCTRGQSRTRTLRPNPAEYQALHAARQRQSPPEFRAQYAKRAGVEGTISQAVRESRIATSSLHGTEASTPPSVHHRSGPEFAPDGGLVSRDPSCSPPHVPVYCAHRLCSETTSHCLGYNTSPTISGRRLNPPAGAATVG